MIIIKHMPIIILFTCFSLYGSAQAPHKQIYKCYITGDIAKWEIIMNDFADKQLSNAEKYELLNYYYGYIGYQLGIKNKTKAQVYIKKGDAIINELIISNPTADAYAYKGAFIGFKIGVSPMKAPFIGKSAAANVTKAIEINPDNIQANIEKANVLYYSPAAFGGDKDEAKKYYDKAVSLFENKPNQVFENWNYLNLLTSIARIYVDEKKYIEAKQMYEKILKIEPDYSYVKNELYPKLSKQL